jgi:hypothetical protein
MATPHELLSRGPHHGLRRLLGLQVVPSDSSEEVGIRRLCHRRSSDTDRASVYISSFFVCVFVVLSLSLVLPVGANERAKYLRSRPSDIQGFRLPFRCLKGVCGVVVVAARGGGEGGRTAQGARHVVREHKHLLGTSLHAVDWWTS